MRSLTTVFLASLFVLLIAMPVLANDDDIFEFVPWFSISKPFNEVKTGEGQRIETFSKLNSQFVVSLRCSHDKYKLTIEGISDSPFHINSLDLSTDNNKSYEYFDFKKLDDVFYDKMPLFKKIVGDANDKVKFSKAVFLTSYHIIGKRTFVFLRIDEYYYNNLIDDMMRSDYLNVTFSKKDKKHTMKVPLKKFADQMHRTFGEDYTKVCGGKN